MKTSVCLICCDPIPGVVVKANLTSPRRPPRRRLKRDGTFELFQVLATHMEWECWDNKWVTAEALQFCGPCKGWVEELVSADSQMVELMKQIRQISYKISAKILESYEATSTPVLTSDKTEADDERSKPEESHNEDLKDDAKNVLKGESKLKDIDQHSEEAQFYRIQTISRFVPAVRCPRVNIPPDVMQKSLVAVPLTSVPSKHCESEGVGNNYETEDLDGQDFSPPATPESPDPDYTNSDYEESNKPSKKLKANDAEPWRHAARKPCSGLETIGENRFSYKGKHEVEKVGSSFNCLTDDCTFSTISKKEMGTHIIEVHCGGLVEKDPSRICQHCGKEFEYPGKLKSHLRIHKERQACEFCGKSYKVREALKYHQEHCAARKARANTQLPQASNSSETEKSNHASNLKPGTLVESADKINPGEDCHLTPKPKKKSEEWRFAARNPSSGLKPIGGNQFCFNGKHYVAQVGKNYICLTDDCTFKTHFKKVMSSHIIGIHCGGQVEKDLSRTCEHCGKEFGFPAQLNKHLKAVHKNERPEICDICEKTYVTPEQLQDHKKQAHEPGKAITSLPSGNNSDAEDITPLDPGFNFDPPKPISRRTSVGETKQDLQNLEEWRHAPRKPSSGLEAINEFKFTYKGQYHVEKVGKDYVCLTPGCVYTSISKKEIGTHIIEVHCGGKVEKDPSLTCEHCKKEFDYPGKLRKHLLLHTTERPLVCDICGKTYKAPETLRLHKKHAHGPGKTHMCEFCGKSFYTPTYLRDHITLHTGVILKGGVVCDICGKTVTRVTYHSHMQTHNGRAFKCPTCDKGYTSKHSLQAHIVTKHQGIKPYSCELCGTLFSFRHTIIKHRKFHCPAKKRPKVELVVNDNNDNAPMEVENPSATEEELPYSLQVVVGS